MADVVIRGIDPTTQISLSVYEKYEVIVLPEDHGPLIDKSKIGLTGIEIAMCNGDFREALCTYIESVEKAPVLLEAESSLYKLWKEMEK